jgi:acyl-CoA synthetase (AMP-forming)/AMP-acid ligase II
MTSSLPSYPDVIRSAFRDSEHWPNKTYADLIDRWAWIDPSRAALADQRSSYTYGEVRDLSVSIAGQLWARGVRPGDRVGLHVTNAAESILMRVALNRFGAIVVQIHRALTEPEVRYVLDQTGTRRLLAPVAAAATLAGLQEAGLLDDVYTYGGPTPHGAVDFADLLQPGGAGEADWQGSRPSANDIFNIGSTSGTEDKPKFFADSPQKWVCGSLNLMNGALCGPETVVMDMPPVTGGLGYFATFMPFAIGGRLVLLEDFDPGEALATIARERVTYLVGLPTQLIKMLHDPAFERTDLSSLRVVINAGGPLPYANAKEIEERTGVPVVQTCGTVEAGPTLMSVPSDAAEKRWGTVGRLSPGAWVRIVDDAGNDVEPGTTGEAWWSGDTVSAGYIDGTPLFDADGWIHSGDLYVSDDEGYFQIVGRKKDMIIRGGQNISVQEVENYLVEHPRVEQVAIVGMPDEVYGERACAFVVTRDGDPLGLDEVKAFLAERQVGKYKWPERIETVSELPHGPGGKVKKESLREQIRETLASERA